MNSSGSSGKYRKVLCGRTAGAFASQSPARTRMGRQACRLAFAALAIAGSMAPLAAQIPPPFPNPATCPIPAGIQSFVLEEVIGPTSFGSDFIPTFPPAAIAALSNPALEARIHVVFDTTSMINKAWVIAVPLGSPAITPATTNFDAVSLATSIAQITNILTVCYPRPSILIDGPLLSSALIFGLQVGVPHGMGFSFDPTNTTGVNNATNVTVFDAGTSTVFNPVASAVVVPAAVSSVITGAPTITALTREYILDGTASASASGTMSYQWSVAAGVNVGIFDPTSAQTRISINGPAGAYPVTLTVSTPTASASTTVTVNYTPRT